MSIFLNIDEASEGLLQGVSRGPDTGFIENTAAAFEKTKLTDLTISDDLNFTHAYDDLLSSVNAELPDDAKLINPYRAEASANVRRSLRFDVPTVDTAEQNRRERAQLPRSEQIALLWGHISKRRAADPQALLDVPATREQFEQGVRESVAARVRELDEVNSRADGFGQVGIFTGTAGALLFQEPLTLATLPLGAPARAGILRTALLEATIAGGVETIIQPSVQAYREELGLEAGAHIGFQNIVTAMGGAFVFGGTVKAIGKALGKAGGAFETVAGLDKQELADAFDELVPNPTAEQRAARQALQLELDLEDSNPLGPARYDEHVETLENAINRHGEIRTRARADLGDELLGAHADSLAARIDGLEADLIGPAADPRLADRQLAFAELDDVGDTRVELRSLAEVKETLDADRALLNELEACA